MKKLDIWAKTIKDIASGNNYKISNSSNLEFQLFIDNWHAVAMVEVFTH